MPTDPQFDAPQSASDKWLNAAIGYAMLGNVNMAAWCWSEAKKLIESEDGDGE